MDLCEGLKSDKKTTNYDYPDLSHLDKKLAAEYKTFFDKTRHYYAKDKNDTGTFKGFTFTPTLRPEAEHRGHQKKRKMPPNIAKVVDEIILDYVKKGIFELSTGRAGKYCCNINPVMKFSANQSKASSQADKYLLKQRMKNEQNGAKSDFISTYRLTMDLKQVCQTVIKDESHLVLPSIADIERKVKNCKITTLDIAGAFNSLVLTSGISRNIYNFYSPSTTCLLYTSPSTRDS